MTCVDALREVLDFFVLVLFFAEEPAFLLVSIKLRSSIPVPSKLGIGSLKNRKYIKYKN